jgi:hypothetical protein
MKADRAGTHGLLAQFGEPEALREAVQRVKARGYSELEAYTPFMVEGLVDDLGTRDDRVPRVVFAIGMFGALAGFGVQVYASVYDYPLNIGGRPDYSWPSFIPVTFEMAVLFAAFAAVFGMLAMNGLPRFHHPAFGVPAFDRVTDDKFFLCVEASDPKFDAAETRRLLESLGAESVSEVPIE